MRYDKLVGAAVAFAVAAAVPVWAIPGPASPGAATHAAATGDHSEAAPHSEDDGVNHETDHEAMDKRMAERDGSFPAKTAGVGAPVAKPEVLPDGTKEFRLTAKVVSWEVEPGKRVQAWSLNGVVPGPTLKVAVGDKVRVVVRNELPESTGLHWHGVVVPNRMDGVPHATQDPIRPGHSFRYEFTAERRAVGWYHSHHNGVKQVGSGMWGMVLIGEMPRPDGVTVARSLTMQVQDSAAVGLTINGKSFPATAPVRARRGEWVEVHYLNAGQQAHPMHLHGVDQLVMAKDGFPLPRPYSADTILVGPGERYTVLIHANRPGTWLWHCHIFSHAEGTQGMFGMVTEMIID